MSKKGRLLLVPTLLGGDDITWIAPATLELLRPIRFFVVENERSARRFLVKAGIHHAIDACKFLLLDKHQTNPNAPLPPFYLAAALEGNDVALLSEAGCPAVADPGAALVLEAHRLGIEVVPLVGPSSILLALMASGLNGQKFMFHGYLPIDAAERVRSIKWLEKVSKQQRCTQICIEAPYRNTAFLKTILQNCQPHTLLSVAADLTLPTQYIATKTIAHWNKSSLPDLHKRPCIFSFLSS